MLTKKIAFDTNVVGTLFDRYGLQIWQRVNRAEWAVYLPIIVYAEQAVWRGDTVNAVVEAFGAQVISLERQHADALGTMWDNLRNRRRPGEKPEDLWKRHKCDWLIAAMAKRENWLLVSNDNDFQRIKDDVDLEVLRLDEFLDGYLSSELSD